jgi:hypothetical protein
MQQLPMQQQQQHSSLVMCVLSNVYLSAQHRSRWAIYPSLDYKESRKKAGLLFGQTQTIEMLPDRPAAGTQTTGLVDE